MSVRLLVLVRVVACVWSLPRPRVARLLPWTLFHQDLVLLQHVPPTVGILLPHLCCKWTLTDNSILPCVSGGSLVLAVALLIAVLCRLWGPLVRGEAEVRSLGRVVRGHLPGCVPGVVLVPLAVLVDVSAHGHVCLPVGLMRTIRRSIPL